MGPRMVKDARRRGRRQRYPGGGELGLRFRLPRPPALSRAGLLSWSSRGVSKRLLPQVPVLGSIEMRAQALATEIAGFRFPEPKARIHIIAHSMGGLDAR